MDHEAALIMNALPLDEWNKAYEKPPNAYIHRDDLGRLCIYPLDGGFLRTTTEKMVGDIAPFSD